MTETQVLHEIMRLASYLRYGSDVRTAIENAASAAIRDDRTGLKQGKSQK